MQQPAPPPPFALCKTGCGFCANPGCDDMCSLCYKKAVGKTSVRVHIESPKTQPDVPEVAAKLEPVQVESEPKRKRCLICMKKLSLITEFTCKCTGCFCITHRYPEEHKCSYDHKGEQRRRLASDNPCVVAAKVQKL